MIYKIYSVKEKEKYFEDYINTIIYNKHEDDEIIIVHYNEFTQFNKILDPLSKHIFLAKFPINIVPYLQNLLNNNIDISLINTEQLSLPNHFRYCKNLPPKVKIIDYSLSNTLLLYRFRQNVYWVPYQINTKEIYNDINKTKDICMVFPGNQSVRRHNILRQLRKNKVPIEIVKGWGKNRDLNLFKYKIIVNVHFNIHYKIFEELRCNRCVFNKMIVISETSIFDNTNPLKKYMIIVPYTQLIQKIKDVYNNYEKYYNELFDNYNEEEIRLEYQKYYDKFFEKNNNLIHS